MKEIGSFIEMQFPNTGEYYKGDNVARLNTGRAAIYHAFRLTGCKTLWLPYYLCLSVQEFLKKKNVPLMFYNIGSDLRPINLNPCKDDAVLLVNYFGTQTNIEIGDIAEKYENVIVDNSHAFFCKPIRGTKTIYSCRKFFGVPDGAYVIAEDAQKYLDEYEQGYSSQYASFLLKRIEYGCKGQSYHDRMINEERLNREPVLKMSKLTHTILCSIDYEEVKRVRMANYEYLASRLGEKNLLQFHNKKVEVPMVYPFFVKDDSLQQKLINNGHYQGPWWEHLLDEHLYELKKDSVEYLLSRYMVPLTIDQRYGEEEMKRIIKLVS